MQENIFAYQVFFLLCVRFVWKLGEGFGGMLMIFGVSVPKDLMFANFLVWAKTDFKSNWIVEKSQNLS